MTSRVILPAKGSTEIVNYALDFVEQIPTDAVLSAATASMAVYSGVDAAVASMVVSCSFSGSIATAKIQAGVAGAIYLLTVTGTHSTGTATMSGFIAILP